MHLSEAGPMLQSLLLSSMFDSKVFMGTHMGVFMGV